MRPDRVPRGAWAGVLSLQAGCAMIHTVIHIIGCVGVCALAMFAFCAMLLVLYVAVARVSGQ